jgi:allophanate hydrolase
MTPETLTLDEWRTLAGDAGALRAALHALVAAAAADTTNAWIHVADTAQLDEQLHELARLRTAHGDATLSLLGVPVAVKDNIDVGGWPTTAACPDFRYIAAADATVVARLRSAGAVIVGKTNLDQFATGLVGTRSPYGAVANSLDSRYISGGSSAGSANVVARGIVPVALGTDTAGSGRVPAGFNNIVGLKPTRGLLPTTGVVPACRSLDCVSVFALTVADAARVADIAAGPDGADGYARARPNTAPAAMRTEPRIAVPAQPEFFGDEVAREAYEAALEHLVQLGATLHPIDFAPFVELAALLYQGPWVTERAFAAAEVMRAGRLDPVVGGILAGAARFSAHDAWRAEYRRAELQLRIHAALAGYAALVVPTTPTHYTLEDITREPVLYNSRLGTYTNFANLADLCALALPGPFRRDGLPAGITLLAPAWQDTALADLGARWERHLGLSLGATGARRAAPSLPPATGCQRLAVVGAHLSGMPLNSQLQERGARLLATVRTAPHYRLFALPDTQPPKPGMVRVESAGSAIELEVWDMPLGHWGSFVSLVPPPLAIGSIELADGSWVKGFVCESAAVAHARDISASGGWRAWLRSQA